MHKPALLFLFMVMVAPVFAQSNAKLDAFIHNKNFDWQIHRSGNFTGYTVKRSFADSSIQDLLAQLEADRKAIITYLGIENANAKNYIFIVGTKEDFTRLMGFEAQGFAIAEDSIVVFLQNATYTLKSKHELCHLFSYQLWGRPANSWMNEGLAVAYDNEWSGYKINALAKHLKDNRKFYPLNKLLKNLYSLNAMIAYPQIGSFSRFLLDVYGKDTFKQFWQGKTAAVQTIFGKNVDGLEDEWERYLDKVEADGIKYSTTHSALLKM